MKVDGKRLPPKVSINVLRDHFRTTYKLTEDQIDTMLEASTKSVTVSLAALFAALESGDTEELFRTAHSLKGLLLNMGEKEWAELARELELASADKNKQDYFSMIKSIEYGVGDLL